MTPVHPMRVVYHFLDLLALVLALSFIIPIYGSSQMCDPMPSLECEDAPVFCSLASLDGYSCINPTQANTSGPSPLCPQGGVPNNLSWWAFVSGGGELELEITTGNCSGSQTPGIQVGIYTDCKFTEAIACEAECFIGTRVLSAITDACQVYYVFVDGCNGASCEYTIRVLSGMDPAEDVAQPELELVETACLGSEVCARVVDYQGCSSDFIWSVNGIEKGETGEEFCYVYPSPGIYTVCVQGILGNSGSPCERSNPTCKQVNIPEIPVIQLQDEKVCYEDRTELFFVECASPVPTIPGKYNICCSSISPEGCLNRLCKEYEIFPPSGMDRVVSYYCEKGVVELPDGRLTENCGAFTIPVPEGDRNGCDSNYIIDVIFLDPAIEFTIPDCGQDEYCVTAEITIPCLEILPVYDMYWTSFDGNDTLAFGTSRFCAPARGTYCLTIDLKLNDQQCISHRECLDIPALAEFIRSDNGLICPDEIVVDTFFFRGRYSLDEYRWSISGGEIIEVAEDTIIKWEASEGQSEIRLCVEGFKDKCKVVDTCFVSKVMDTPSAVFGWKQKGNTLIFNANTSKLGNSFWFINGMEYEGDTVQVPFFRDQMVNVQHFRSNSCDTSNQFLPVPFRLALSYDDRLPYNLDGLPVHSLKKTQFDNEVYRDQSHTLLFFDLSGKLVFSQKKEPGSVIIISKDLASFELPDGIYILAIQNDITGDRIVRKVAIFR